MRIGIEAQRILRSKKHGMDVVALELIKNLQQVDRDNDYYVFARKDEDEQAIIETSNFKIEKISSLSYFDWEQIRLKKSVKDNNIDLLHCTANTAPLSTHVPLIVTIHDIIYLESLDFNGTVYQNLGNLYRRLLVPKIARKAALVLTVSNYERENIIKRLELPENKVQVLYNGVSERFSTKFTSEEISDFRKKYKLPERYIMFLGNTAPKKNTTNVIKAYVQYCLSEKDAVSIVFLDYKKELVTKLLKELGHEQIIDKFIFPGYVAHYEIPLMYSASSLFLYPSLRESFGLPILEAMACGTPVITSNTSSMPEIAGDAAIQIDPVNFFEIADAIKSLMRNDSYQKNYIEKGLERVKKFTWRASAEKLKAIYNNFQ